MGSRGSLHRHRFSRSSSSSSGRRPAVTSSDSLPLAAGRLFYFLSGRSQGFSQFFIQGFPAPSSPSRDRAAPRACVLPSSPSSPSPTSHSLPPRPTSSALTRSSRVRGTGVWERQSGCGTGDVCAARQCSSRMSGRRGVFCLSLSLPRASSQHNTCSLRLTSVRPRSGDGRLERARSARQPRHAPQGSGPVSTRRRVAVLLVSSFLLLSSLAVPCLSL